MCSTTAHAILRPSNVLVPRPISSRIIRLLDVALRRILAGVPENVLNRAKELVVELSDADISQKAKDIAQYSKKVEKMNDRYKKVNELEVKQMTLFDTVKDDDIIKDIKELDISNMTPIDALNILYKLQGKVKNRYFVMRINVK